MPYPGLAVDRYWTVIQFNAAPAQLYGQSGVTIGNSLVELMTSDISPNVIENWPEVAHHAARRLRLYNTALGGIPQFDHASAKLSQVEGCDRLGSSPFIPTVFNNGEYKLSMFATLAQFGTPEDALRDDLKIERYYSMDPKTAAIFKVLGQ
ncbi:hypothetical protein [Algirhabdus cladophorae]|uniref:MmyB family transcriptional regulator n=1 Tax=Algirhabdus cladophorae TaxID=3377108 RepID=UPI003B84A4EA